MTRDHSGRKARLIQESRHDTYMDTDKRSDPDRCTQCNAVYAEGRWGAVGVVSRRLSGTYSRNQIRSGFLLMQTRV